MSKKKLFSLSLVVMMIAILSFSTLAWFSASDTVENKFMVAGSDDEKPEEIFSVEVKEITPEGEKDGYEYQNILPGDQLTKDVTVKNTGSYTQYVRVIVTISDAEAWVNALGTTFDASTLFVGFDGAKWNHIWNNLNGATTMPEDIIYVLYYKDVLDVNGTIDVFDAVKIPDTLTKEQAAKFDGGFTIDVKAQAVQTKNVVPEGTAAEDAAWKAFQTVNMQISE